MEQTREAITTNLAERWCGQVARREDVRVARRLYRKPVVDGVYPLDAGALLEEFLQCLRALGVVALLEYGRGKGLEREMGPMVQSVLRYGRKSLFGLERMHALPEWLCSDEASRRLVGFKAHQVRHGVCHRGAAKRQGPRTAGPICPEALANHLVKLAVRALEALFNGAIRALAQAGVFQAQVTGMVEGTDLETTAHYQGCGQVTRTRPLTDTRGKGRESEVTVYGWKVIIVIAALTRLPLAVKGVKIHAHEGLSLRALVTQARTNLAGSARGHKVVFARGWLAGTDLWGLAQPGRLVVVPAQDDMAVTADARALAAAGDALAVGPRVPTTRHGQGRAAWRERLETEVVGLTGLTTEEQYGTPAHGRQANRRDFQANPITAVVVRTWPGKDSGPGGKTVVVTNAPVDKPLQPLDDDDDRRRIDHGGLKEAKQPWELGHPPQQHERAVRVHVVFTLRLFALATASRLPCEREAMGDEPVGWQRWRRQLLQQHREKMIVLAQGCYGILPMAEFALLLGVKLTDVPPGIGTRQEILAKDGLTSHA
jgi:hypothetical protein